MKKIFNIIISTLLLSLLNFQTTYAYVNEAYGNAEILKITMRKVELCTGFQGGDFDDILTDAFCNDPVVIGSGDKEVNIASVTAGASAAAYGKPTLLPLGETYTHLRVTIDRGFKIKAEEPFSTGSTSGDTDFCATKIVTDAMYGGGTGQSGKKYTHRVAVDPVADANVATEEMNLYWVNGKKSTDSGFTFTHCYNDTCGESDSNWWWGYNGQNSDVSGLPNTEVAMSIPRSSATDDLVLVYALSKPYTVSMKPPSIDIAFSTKDGVLAGEASKSEGSGTASKNDGKCIFTVGKVFVKITISEKRSRGTWR